MRSEVATSIPSERRRHGTARKSARRGLAVQLLGPLTIVGGIVWAVAQPYRIVLDRAGHNVYDYVFQAPLLVVLVGLAFTFLVAPGLVDDLEAVEHDPDPEG